MSRSLIKRLPSSSATSPHGEVSPVSRSVAFSAAGSPFEAGPSAVRVSGLGSVLAELQPGQHQAGHDSQHDHEIGEPAHQR